MKGDIDMTVEDSVMQVSSEPRFYTLAEEHGVDWAGLDNQQKAMWERQEAFLATFAETGSIRRSAHAVGISRQSVNNWQHANSLGFMSRFEVARQQWKDTLEDEAWGRIKDPKGNRGSDTLLMAMLNAHHEAYRPKPGNDSLSDVRDILHHLTQLAGPARSLVIEGEARPVEELQLPADLESMRAASEG
jgi:hypothetical protein